MAKTKKRIVASKRGKATTKPVRKKATKHPALRKAKSKVLRAGTSEDEPSADRCPICKGKNCRKHLLARFDTSGDDGAFGIGLVDGALCDVNEIGMVLEHARLAWVQSVRATGKPEPVDWMIEEERLLDYYDALGDAGGLDFVKNNKENDGYAARQLSAYTNNDNIRGRELLEDLLCNCGNWVTTREDFDAQMMRSTSYLSLWAFKPREIVKKFRAKLRRILLEAGVKVKSISRATREKQELERLAEGALRLMKEMEAADAEINAVRPGEPALGSLKADEQCWLRTALDYLKQIYENRESGRLGKEAFCIFAVGKAYVQFRASWDARELVCEAVSAKSVPEIAEVLTTEGEETLRKLGFEAPKSSPNYSQTIKIEDIKDLAYAARLAFRALKQAYQVTNFDFISFKKNIPGAALKNKRQRQTV
jgi:hypothetical protein